VVALWLAWFRSEPIQNGKRLDDCIGDLKHPTDPEKQSDTARHSRWGPTQRWQFGLCIIHAFFDAEKQN
jgi:hypothetical protein